MPRVADAFADPRFAEERAWAEPFGEDFRAAWDAATRAHVLQQIAFFLLGFVEDPRAHREQMWRLHAATGMADAENAGSALATLAMPPTPRGYGYPKPGPARPPTTRKARLRWTREAIDIDDLLTAAFPRR